MTNIRDAAAPHLEHPGSREDLGRAAYEQELIEIAEKLHQNPVSYTHLTLPTICSV